MSAPANCPVGEPIRILARQHPPADEQVEPAVAIKIGGGHGAHAEEQRRQGIVSRRPEAAMAVIQK